LNFSNLNIAVRLTVLTAALILATMIVGLIGWQSLSTSNLRASELMEKAAVFESAVNLARKSQVDFKIQIQEWKNILLRGKDPAQFAKYRSEFAKKGEETQAELVRLEKVLNSAGIATPLIRQAATANAQLSEKYLEALNQFDQANPDSAQIVDGLVKGMDRGPTKMIDEIVAFVLETSAAQMQKDSVLAQKQYESTVAIFLSIIALSAVLSIAATYSIITRITRPLRDAVRIAGNVASGDLTSRFEAHTKDEVGELVGALRRMNDNLVSIVSRMQISTGTITASSMSIASGNHDLSSRTVQQTSALEETASSIKELTSTVSQNAENAKLADQLVASASEVAMKGGEVVTEVVSTMNSINESANKIADIIGVIDGIAFQTNILALNAAVEAARAGEQGRGFAVVATEVRSLAQRSASAAREIKVLIGDAVERVGIGSHLVQQAGKTMDDIVNSVQRVNSIMAEITMASQEQSAGIAQVNKAIGEMELTTQQNAALVEEAASSSVSLQEQADNLAQVVAIFRLEGNHGDAVKSNR
jgi:methyl-accepting chemotaxis protein-1 (serine sensor receptor)